MRLYHYTCRHMARAIDADGVLIPHAPAWWDRPVVWLTDMKHPHAKRLGLQSTMLDCDRTEVRYEVDAPRAVPWVDVDGVAPAVRELVESGRAPERWWVSFDPVEVAS